MGKLNKEDVELAVEKGVIEGGEGEKLQRAIKDFEAGEKDPKTEEEINKLLERISAM